MADQLLGQIDFSRYQRWFNRYDSITSSRAYRAGRPHKFAMAEIARVSGTQLDPAMVEVFAKICEAEPEWLERFNIRRERAFIDPRGAPRVDRGPDYTPA